jgi:hypothetical protein
VLGLGLWYYYQAEVSEKLLGLRPAQLAKSSAGRLPVLAKLGLVPSPFGLADYEGVYLVLFPILGRPFEGMVVALVGGVLSRGWAAYVVLQQLRARAADEAHR